MAFRLVLTSLAAAAILGAQGPAPDLVLSNGKIITVDDRFTIAQAVAIHDDRIIAVGTNQEMARLAGPNTRRIVLISRESRDNRSGGMSQLCSFATGPVNAAPLRAR
jgi:hypothetical protein